MPCTRRPRLLIGRAASLFKQWPNFGEFTKDEARRSGRQAAGRITIIPDFVRMQAVTSVQQPCSNPSKSPDRASIVAFRTQVTLTWVFSRSNLASVQHGPHRRYRRHLLRSYAPSYSAFLEAYKACRRALDFGGYVHSPPFPHARYSAGEDVTLAEKLSTRVKYTSPGSVGAG